MSGRLTTHEMLTFLDINFNHIDQLVREDGGDSLWKLMVGTIFGFALSEGNSYLKEYKRAKRVGKNFYHEVNYLKGTLQSQIQYIENDIAQIDIDRMRYTGGGLILNQGLDTSTLISISKDDIIKYLKGRAKPQVIMEHIKKLYLNLEICKIQYVEITKLLEDIRKKGSLITEKLLGHFNDLQRQYADLIAELERKEQNINSDPLLKELFFISDPNKRAYEVEEVYKILMAFAEILSRHRKDSRTDQLSEHLRPSFDTCTSLKSHFLAFKNSLSSIREILFQVLKKLEEDTIIKSLNTEK